jgi:hypothetical protein
VASGHTNKVRAFRADLSPSSVTSGIFTNKVGTPFFDPPQGPVTNTTLISIGTVTPGASIFYTTNGVTPTNTSLVYSGPFVFPGNFTLKAVGIASGYSNSTIASAAYSLAQVATPVFSPASGPITNGTTISITCATAGATLYVTTNGIVPTTNSAVYSGPLVINGGTPVQALGVEKNYLDSLVQNVLYDLLKVATPTFDPPQGPTTNISISCATTNATVRYTLDGSDPTTSSPAYTSPIVINALTTLTARGFRSDLASSDPLSVSFGFISVENTVVTTFAGSTSPGFSNGVSALASFSSPVDVCRDAAGNLYVADNGNNVIRRISASGSVETFAGTGVFGYQDGSVTNARFAGPTGICADQAGNFYVADTSCFNTRVRRIDTNGNVTTFVPAPGPATCDFYRTLEMGPDGNLYVGFQGSLQEVFPDGSNAIIAGPGYCTAGWCISVGVSVDSLTNVYAATESRLWQLPPGQPPVTFAGSDAGMGGFSDGPRLQAIFGGPLDVAAVAGGTLYVSDRTSIRKIRSDGAVTTRAGRNVAGYVNGRGVDARFKFAVGICADSSGNVYVADKGNNCIRKISPDSAGIGIADDWQFAHFGHVGIDPNDDPDHDGLSNFTEFWAGTDPLDSSSSFAIDRGSAVTDGHMQLRWKTVAGKSYAVQYSTDLFSWTDVGSEVFGDGSMASLTDSSAVTGRGFYRIRLTGF